jgi:NADPH:quinone reductase-like Zn-dependent oxidoreductase
VRAVRIHAHGGPEVLRVDEIPEPEPGPGDLLVRLRATSVNHRDVWIRRGHPHPAYHVDLPAVLGIDVWGDVVSVGAEVEGFHPGDRVTANPYMPCGRCRYCLGGRFQLCPRFAVYTGTYAELFLVPARFAVRVDPAVPDEHVAAFPNTYITAWQMLVGKARVGPEDVVFVWGGTSGLGSAGIQIAKLAGATVLASAGDEEKREVLRRNLPVDHVLDHHAPDLVDRVHELTDGEGATNDFENIGAATWRRSLELAAPGGTIVVAGATSGDDAATDVTYLFVKQLRVLGSRLGTMRDAFDAARQLSAGRFTPLVGAVLPLEGVAEAHALMDEGKVIGKVIVKPEA